MESSSGRHQRPQRVLAHTPTGRKASFGQLAAAAAKLPLPTDVKLKNAKDYKLIGQRLPRLDSHAKTDGSAVFTSDVKFQDC